MTASDHLSPQEFNLPVSEVSVSSVDVGCSHHTAGCYHREGGHAYHDWGDDDLSPDHEVQYVRKMAENIDNLPPIIVQQRGAGHSLIGGGHRIAAHNEVGRSSVKARVIPESASWETKEIPQYIDAHRDDD